MRKLPAFAAVTAVALLALTACTTTTDDNTGSTSSGTASTRPTFDPSTVKADDALHALLPKTIQDAGVLNVATNPTYAPAEFLADDGKTQIGYDMDLIRAIGARLGVKVNISSADFDSIIPAIGTKYDAGISSFTITDAREKQVNMISYFSAGEAFAVIKGNPQKLDPSDVCGLAVTVETGTVEDDDIAAISKKCVTGGKKAVEILRYPSQADATTNLLGGKADLMFADSPIVGYAIEQTGGKIEQLGKVLATAPQGIVVAKSDTQLSDAIQKAVQSLIDDGTYAKILDNWNNTAGAVDKAQINPPSE